MNTNHRYNPNKANPASVSETRIDLQQMPTETQQPRRTDASSKKAPYTLEFRDQNGKVIRQSTIDMTPAQLQKFSAKMDAAVNNAHDATSLRECTTNFCPTFAQLAECRDNIRNRIYQVNLLDCMVASSACLCSWLINGFAPNFINSLVQNSLGILSGNRNNTSGYNNFFV